LLLTMSWKEPKVEPSPGFFPVSEAEINRKPDLKDLYLAVSSLNMGHGSPVIGVPLHHHQVVTSQPPNSSTSAILVKSEKDRLVISSSVHNSTTAKMPYMDSLCDTSSLMPPPFDLPIHKQLYDNPYQKPRDSPTLTSTFRAPVFDILDTSISISMDPREVEFTSLLGWLRTFALQSEASTAAELSDGLAMSEALVQIEPAVFTPSWFAGILKSENTNQQTLSIILNLLLHFYRQNLEDVVNTGELPVPEIPEGEQELSKEMIARFLKLMLGVAVTCSNKLLFINKIQSLDETTQHALTACVASFIYTKVSQTPLDSIKYML